MHRSNQLYQRETFTGEILVKVEKAKKYKNKNVPISHAQYSVHIAVTTLKFSHNVELKNVGEQLIPTKCPKINTFRDMRPRKCPRASTNQWALSAMFLGQSA